MGTRKNQKLSRELLLKAALAKRENRPCSCRGVSRNC